MRILTVRQPWAWAIIHGGKDVENRSRNIAGSYRGPVAIHVATKYAEGDVGEALIQVAERWHDQPGADCNRHPWEANVGRIIGVVDLVDVHGPCDGMRSASRGHNQAGTLFWGTWESCGQWAQQGAHHLVLANPRPLAEPIPYRGALGLRTLDDATAARVLEAGA